MRGAVKNLGQIWDKSSTVNGGSKQPPCGRASRREEARMSNADDWTPLAALYEWERRQPEAVYLTQPVGTQVTDYTWAMVGDQVRRVAAHLQSLQLPPRSQIALLSKNCAHWIMADLA